MALKSREWFLSCCYREVRRLGKLTYLANRALELGLIGTECTQGHILQACGAVQKFSEQYPSHKNTVRQASPFDPFALSGPILKDWLDFFSQHAGQYGRRKFGYNWDTLRTYLTIKYGGRTTSGGGGDNEFEIVFRLMADFL